MRNFGASLQVFEHDLAHTEMFLASNIRLVLFFFFTREGLILYGFVKKHITVLQVYLIIISTQKI